MISFLRNIRFELVFNDIILFIYLFFSLYWVVLLLVIKLKELLFQIQKKLLSIYENAFALGFTYIMLL
jgi:hypothetical protein